MDLYEVLDNLQISYQEVRHPKVCTVLEMQKLHLDIQGVGCKNLFLKAKDHYYLYVLEENKRADLKFLARFLQVSHLSFASEEELQNILGLEKGSVTPLGILHDKQNLVTILLDKDLVGKKILVHPNRNDRTLSLSFDDLLKVIQYLHHEYYLI